MVLVGPLLDAVLDVTFFEQRGSGMGVIGFVGVDGLLIAHDQSVSHDGFVDVGTRK